MRNSCFCLRFVLPRRRCHPPPTDVRSPVRLFRRVFFVIRRFPRNQAKTGGRPCPLGPQRRHRVRNAFAVEKRVRLPQYGSVTGQVYRPQTGRGFEEDPRDQPFQSGAQEGGVGVSGCRVRQDMYIMTWFVVARCI